MAPRMDLKRQHGSLLTMVASQTLRGRKTKFQSLSLAADNRSINIYITGSYREVQNYIIIYTFRGLTGISGLSQESQ